MRWLDSQASEYAPNERRDQVKFSRRCLIPLPGRKISELEPLNFLSEPDISANGASQLQLSYTDFLARLCFKWKILRNTWYNEKGYFLLSDRHLYDIFWVNPPS